MWALAPWLLAVLVAGGTYLYERATISSLRAEVATLQREIDDPATGWRRQLSVCVDNGMKFTAAIDDTNRRMDDLGRLAQGVRDAQARDNARAALDARTTRNVIMDGLKAPNPIPNGTACENALAIQREPLP